MGTLSKSIFIIILSLICSFLIGKSIYEKEQLNQARTMANMVEHIGQWASQYRGIWTKEAKGEIVDQGSHLDTLTVSLANEDNSITSAEDMATTLNFHLKNPALVQREISDLMIADQSKASYRITSDKFMNARNSPTAFERNAMEYMRANNVTEYSEVSNGRTLYARGLIATAACMRCHESAEKAPYAVRSLYPTQGYGYELGKVSGVISVKIPSSYSASSIFSALNLLSLIALGVFAFIVFLLCRRKANQDWTDQD
ncbi:DUF3365 domain-containing protein [Chitinibacter sp. GC72]|uniref:Tll0287-like domain-containing protein n=1 Tax=Chitinibacter sp. GC72 TaxID=1526917 RepID=UPI0012FA904A|nr:DUF3365 domain-containing protein [Chitinibacter sp. GC72]